MNEIIFKKEIAQHVFHYKINNEFIAQRRKPGQFIILRCSEDGERIPLTIVDSDPSSGTFDIIFQVVGKTTQDLARLNLNSSLTDVAGPLGNPTHIEIHGTCVMIGGGVGIAPLYPITKAFKDKGNTIISILGARSRDLLILYDEFNAISDRTLVATDDGTFGTKGFVSDILISLIESKERIDFVMCIGPVIMMKVLSELTKKHNIKTLASLNPIMLDGTGMCGGCRVTIDGKTQFACVDGPEFDAHSVDFNALLRRLTMFKNHEQHSCKLENNH
ncbi:sulfide/dihydroorotate dehydrogenase-like FAD/NAD-binding protein [Chlamydiota bacterium]